MKKIFVILSISIFVLIMWIMISKSTMPKDSNVVSTNGLHWHSNVEIFVKGEKVEIPANIGLSDGHNPIHTHSEDAPQGVIHMEFEGLVKKEDTKLGNFFNNWNKEIKSFGQNMQMTVNGIENKEFENYEMKDNDKIKLIYE